jgi:hypothetical protein
MLKTSIYKDLVDLQILARKLQKLIMSNFLLLKGGF